MKLFLRRATWRSIALAGAFALPLAQSAPAATTATTFRTITLPVDRLERRALIHVPPSYDGKAPLPLVLVFHGNGGTAEGVASETGWPAKADAAGFLVVFPEATRPDMTQPPRFGRNNPAWNDGSGRFHAGERNIPDVAFIAALLDHLEAKFAVDTRLIFATGFSNGASMVFRVGLELSARIAAIAPVAGALWFPEPRLAQPVSLLYITGTADPLNPIDGGVPRMASGASLRGVPEKAKPPVREMIASWAKALGCAAELTPVAEGIDGVTYVVYGGGRAGTDVALITIAGHGHIWPGGRNRLPQFIVGKATSRLNATDAVWDFFQAHRKQTSAP